MRLGSDPEVFLQDNTGKFISVINMIGADKWNPKQIEGMERGFTLQEDNVALEFGIPPAATEDEYVAHIQRVLDAGLSTLPGLTFSKLSCTVFPKDQMQDPRAHIFGCEPDYNAWNRKVNAKPKPPHPYMRSAGGHIHVETKLPHTHVVQAMDLFLGVPSVLMDKGEDRKKLYGKAGAYRKKPYGVEYRTLSNFWIFDEKLIRWVWRNTKYALDAATVGDMREFKDDIRNAIDNSDKELAKNLVKLCGLEVI